MPTILLVAGILMSMDPVRQMLENVTADLAVIFHDNFVFIILSTIILGAILAIFSNPERSFIFRPIIKTGALLTSFFRWNAEGKTVDSAIDDYNNLHDDSKGGVEERESNYSKLVDSYYELATSFYEWGWGSSFHFAHVKDGENFYEAIRRHEYYLAGRLGVPAGGRLLDAGCGIGGPMRNIARFTGCDITGVTINGFQVKRGNQLNLAAGLAKQCRLVQGDFMKLPFDKESFDGVYAIEATCHAPSREGVYGEIYRVLKPGAIFACYEWCLTDKYDPNNEEHVHIKKLIEEGDGLPDMARTDEVKKSLVEAGFELIEARDCALDAHNEHWYTPLTPSWNPLTQRFQFNPLGLTLTTELLKVLEFTKLAPKGTSKIQQMLQKGGMGCARGGITGIFTPMYLMVGRKPVQPKAAAL